jgi:hypothetical protein
VPIRAEYVEDYKQNKKQEALQKKMFSKPMVAILHLAVYVGFIIINLEVLEIVLDGLLGTHRIFLEPLGNVYSFLINFFDNDVF